MAGRRGEAWLTYVAYDDFISTAMVLAVSLRMSKTTRAISVIMSNDLSKKSRMILRQGFDDVFMLDDELVSSQMDGVFVGFNPKNSINSLRGKIFAFSLQIAWLHRAHLNSSCVQTSPESGHSYFVTSLIKYYLLVTPSRHPPRISFHIDTAPAYLTLLENCDNLFESGKDVLLKDLCGSMDIFLFTPKLSLCEFLEGSRKKLDNAGSEGFFLHQIYNWQKINNHSDNINSKEDVHGFDVVMFSVENRELIIGSGHTHLKMINFVDLPENADVFVRTMTSFEADLNMALTDKMVVEQWQKLLKEQVADFLTNPYVTHAWKNEHKQNLYNAGPIAIIGMSCRFPGASNLKEFWKLLHDGTAGICVPPSFRWKNEQSIVGAVRKQRDTNAGFLSVPVDEFNAKFFGLSPKEAVFLNPQARLLHEVVWECLEDSGIDPPSLRGSHTGIFTGSWMNDYIDIVQTSAERDFFRTYMENSIGATAARLSFLLGVTGPSIATESGCSSAIVAVDLAVKSLRNGESNLAIAGGVNLLLHPFHNSIIEYVVAPNGRCKTFDEKADGFGRAEGCSVLVLKRLSDALRDRDHIWAMIRGSAIAQEGLSRSLGTPTIHSEALCMQLALNDGGVRPEQVSFLEAHGTETIVGDPLEVAAIAQVYHSKARMDPLIIGSVKTNVGHTESCSGIIKTVLAMQHEMIPKHLNFDTLNPDINLDVIPAIILIETVPSKKIYGHARIAGVSSFGITGTDGHVVIKGVARSRIWGDTA